MTIPETQHAAWQDLQPELGDRQLQVYQALHRPSTLFELAARTGLPVNRVSGRVTELVKRGLVADTGLRRVNPDSGKRGIVWGIPC